MNAQGFVEITNREIFDKVCAVENKVDKINGNVKNHSKMIWGLWGVIGTVITMFVAFLLKFV